MVFLRSLISLLLSVTNVYVTLSSEALDVKDSSTHTLVSTSLDTDIKCRTIMTRRFTGEVLTKTATILQTKPAKYSRSVVTPPVPTIYKDAATVVVGTTTSFLIEHHHIHHSRDDFYLVEHGVVHGNGNNHGVWRRWSPKATDQGV